MSKMSISRKLLFLLFVSPLILISGALLQQYVLSATTLIPVWFSVAYFLSPLVVYRLNASVLRYPNKYIHGLYALATFGLIPVYAWFREGYVEAFFSDLRSLSIAEDSPSIDPLCLSYFYGPGDFLLGGVLALPFAILLWGVMTAIAPRWIGKQDDAPFTNIVGVGGVTAIVIGGVFLLYQMSIAFGCQPGA